MIVGDCESAIDELKKMLSQAFHMKDLNAVNYFLGLEIARSPVGFFVSQHKYVLDLLKDFHMNTVSSVKIPLDCHLKLTPHSGDPLPN